MNLPDRFTEEELTDFQKLKSREAKRLFFQTKFKSDFFAFVYLMGYRDIGAFHKKQIKKLSEMRFMTDKPVRRLWLWSRGFFKTSLIIEAHSIWLMVNNPNIRILLVSYTLDIAKKTLGNIRNHFIGNEDFRYFFKEFCPKANKEGKIEFGTTEYFTIPNRKRMLKEPTILAAGIGTNIVGLHFDVQKIDDLVNQASVLNDTQIQASKDYYSLLRPIFDNPTIPREDIVGTIYHFNDLHCNMMKNKEFEQSFIPVKDENGVYNFPERLNKEGLDNLFNDPSINPYDVWRQYLLKPLDPKDSKFKEDWIEYYDDIPEGLAEYVLCDPASKVKKKADYTVVERWGRDSEGIDYLLEGIRDKLTVFQRIDTVVRFSKNAKRLMGVKYEVTGGRHGDLETLQQRFIDENMPIIPIETKATTNSKTDRIEQRLVGRFHARKIRLPRILNYRSDYENKVVDFIQLYKLEYLQFPFTEHDDILDCHSQLYEDLKQLVKGLKSAVENKKKWGTANDWENLYKSIDREQRNNPFISREQAIDKLKNRNFKRLMGVKG